MSNLWSTVCKRVKRQIYTDTQGRIGFSCFLLCFNHQYPSWRGDASPTYPALLLSVASAPPPGKERKCENRLTKRQKSTLHQKGRSFILYSDQTPVSNFKERKKDLLTWRTEVWPEVLYSLNIQWATHSCHRRTTDTTASTTTKSWLMAINNCNWRDSKAVKSTEWAWATWSKAMPWGTLSLFTILMMHVWMKEPNTERVEFVR